MMKFRKMICILLSFACMPACVQKAEDPAEDDKTDITKIGIAWSNVQDSASYLSTIRAVKEAGAEPVLLDQILSYDLTYDEKGILSDAADEHGVLKSDYARMVKTNRWQNSNVAEVVGDLKYIVMPGGWDISPTLYYEEQPWHGIEEEGLCSAERDVSDYLLISYCLDRDIPMLAICRGMQMLSIVSGADMIQDIGTVIENNGGTYHDMHRDPKKEDVVPHEVMLTDKESHLYDIYKTDVLKGAPSWHHQAVVNTEHTRLTVTASVNTDGMDIIEAVERKDKTFCVGVQFHPEFAVRKVLDHEANADNFMTYDEGLALFKALMSVKKEQGEKKV